MSGIRLATVAALTSLLLGCASDYGGSLSGGGDALSPEERRLQNVETRVATLSRRLDAANLGGVDEQNQRTRQDLASLRGDAEKLRYDLTQVQQQQTDLNQRLQRLEAAAQAAAAGQGYGSYGGLPAAPAATPPPDGAAVAPAAAPVTTPGPATAPASAAPSQPAAPAAVPAAAPAAAPAGAAAPGEEAAYLTAFEALKNGKYDDATKGFHAQLEKWPNGKYADSALYWSGEAFYVRADYKSALGAFQAVLQRFPQSVKAPDAMLKMGLTQFELKQPTDARATLQRVVKTYPGSNAARLAQQRLDTGK